MNEDTTSCCASCGKSEGDDIQLRTCTACKSVRYCGVTCQRNHRPKHKKVCKKRAAELRDEILFKQPESSHLGDCPICCVPLPIDLDKSESKGCCNILICKGCVYADMPRQIEVREFDFKCLFCRQPFPKTNEEGNKIFMKRVEANDPVALRNFGKRAFDNGDYDGASKYWNKAAELGDVTAHCSLSILYERGKGVEKDEKKQVYHLEEAAIAGHPKARQNLGNYEHKNGRIDRSVKHYTIAANLGYDDAIQALKNFYRDGTISKDDFATALRGHKAAVDATKSPQRREADWHDNRLREYQARFGS
jgi:tetratricopeptide (TPR) repeat protein